MAENKTIIGEVIIFPFKIGDTNYKLKAVRSGNPPNHTKPPHHSVGFLFPPNDPNGQHEKDLDKAHGVPPKDVSVHYHIDQNGDQIIDQVTIIP